MVRSKVRFLGLAALALMVIAACGSTTNAPAAKVVKVGLVTDIGGLNDKSFNHLAAIGLAKASSTGNICASLTCSKDFSVQGDVVESKTGDDYIPNLTSFASKNYDLVIGVGFLMAEAVGTVSGTFPNIHFAIIDGAGTDAKGNDLKHANVESLFFKEQDAGAMVGVIAGMLEKDKKAPNNNNVIGGVGGISIPPVNHYLAGYKWAAAMEDPGIKVLIGYSNDFTDPAKCKSVATSQIGQKADILFQVAGGCGLGVLQAAGQAKVYSIGVDADQKDADGSVIASALKKVDVATYTAIQGVVNNNFQGGALTFSIANGGAGYALDNLQLPADIQAELDKVQGEIKSGALTPPADIPA
ncbi:MAG TPA: BMP family ABC transporter substrate-binding protein [Candidatus Dormibacteraeota bacterium]|nr:BMP family ABC transporter substrate-binding protein [Candidatus Dormibacteraeota bacterium]